MITNFAHRAQRATTVTTLAGIAMITGFLDRASGSNRRRLTADQCSNTSSSRPAW